MNTDIYLAMFSFSCGNVDFNRGDSWDTVDNSFTIDMGAGERGCSLSYAITLMPVGGVLFVISFLVTHDPIRLVSKI